MSLIKDIYSAAFYDRFTNTVLKVVPSFNKLKFTEDIFGDNFGQKEWKDRMKHTTKVFQEVLGLDFKQAANVILKLIQQLKEEDTGEDRLVYIFFPDYIETYGLNDFDTSIEAFEEVTQFISCEFAVRPFILKYGQKMIDVMTLWSLHKSHKVRRLASEGSRPRLPWAMAIPFLKKDPSSLLPLLENLKNDSSEYVRRSVANNLNDITKDHPDVVIGLALQWAGGSKETDAIIKHGLRSLLKQGHTAVLKHYGLESALLNVEDFKIHTPVVKIGAPVDFSFKVLNNNASPHVVRLEYGIYYMKSKGHHARKVFKISEKLYQPGEQIMVQRKQSFRVITTKKFYTGEHRVSIILNGEEKGILSFELRD
ncbi:DNA alkylation repair protein [Pedobacter sp. MC2016-14]|uniref:DNA alkylation repair protein n=1 Tax=Pedobacter sp. MC2016-14 TaxID=2897327 RepID=UPI001E3B0562|nr:DNA alkylation repair protein [Pedobacter sp. MC2016-14]MCD0488593.1 DNA alkylation repair protein [Pedobacter sp. MC2016-14]